MAWIDHSLVFLTRIIDLIGCAILLYGVLLSFGMMLRSALSGSGPREKRVSFLKVRDVLGRHLLLGLEMMIAADVIHTVLEPSFEDVGIVFVVVIIRTVLSVSLSKEMDNIHKDLQVEK